MAQEVPPTLPDTEIFYAMPSESDTAVVAFGSNGGGHGHFHFFKLLKPLPGFSKLLVRDPTPRWYNAGLPGVGDTLEEIAAGVEREVSLLGATRIVTFGSSMGAYASILFGCMLGAERVIAFSPQTLLDPGLRHSPSADIDLQVADLEPLIQATPGTPVDVVVGWEDHIDVFHSQRVAGLPSVRVLALRERTHSFVLEFSDEGKLLPLLTDLVAGHAPEYCELDPAVDPDTRQRFADTAYATNRGDWEAVKERIGPVAERCPDWAGPNYDLGRALAEMEDWPGAEAAHARAVRASPNWTQPRAYLISTLLAQDRPAEAEVTARGGLALDPDWARGHLLVARCASRRDRAEDAQAAALRAIELDPKLREAAEPYLPTTR